MRAADDPSARRLVQAVEVIATATASRDEGHTRHPGTLERIATSLERIADYLGAVASHVHRIDERDAKRGDW